MSTLVLDSQPRPTTPPAPARASPTLGFTPPSTSPAASTSQVAPLHLPPAPTPPIEEVPLPHPPPPPPKAASATSQLAPPHLPLAPTPPTEEVPLPHPPPPPPTAASATSQLAPPHLPLTPTPPTEEVSAHSPTPPPPTTPAPSHRQTLLEKIRTKYPLANFEEGKTGCRCLIRKWRFCEAIKQMAPNGKVTPSLLKTRSRKEMEDDSQINPSTNPSSDQPPSSSSEDKTSNIVILPETSSSPQQTESQQPQHVDHREVQPEVVDNPTPMLPEEAQCAPPMPARVNSDLVQLVQPTLIVNGSMSNLVIISRNVTADIQPIKRKRGPRPKDRVNYVQSDLRNCLSTQRRVARAGRRAVVSFN